VNAALDELEEQIDEAAAPLLAEMLHRTYNGPEFTIESSWEPDADAAASDTAHLAYAIEELALLASPSLQAKLEAYYLCTCFITTCACLQTHVITCLLCIVQLSSKHT
jgi:hypothetical protein